jgi:hypothetical protein
MKRLTPHQLKSHSPRECAEWKRRVECRINVVWMPENDAIQIRLAVQLTGHECRPKRNFDRLTSGMSQQTGSCHGQITKAIFWDIRDCQCERVWRFSKGDVDPPILGLRKVENLQSA